MAIVVAARRGLVSHCARNDATEHAQKFVYGELLCALRVSSSRVERLRAEGSLAWITGARGGAKKRTTGFSVDRRCPLRTRGAAC